MSFIKMEVSSNDWISNTILPLMTQQEAETEVSRPTATLASRFGTTFWHSMHQMQHFKRHFEDFEQSFPAKRIKNQGSFLSNRLKTSLAAGLACDRRSAVRLLSLKSVASQLSYAPACASRKKYQICCLHFCQFLLLSCGNWPNIIGATLVALQGEPTRCIFICMTTSIFF